MIEMAEQKPRAFLKGGIMVVMLGAICMSDGAQTSRPQREDFFSQFRIITERNIFSRQRSHRTIESRTDGNRPVRQAIRRSTESYMVLGGIAKVDDVYVAFFEDTRGGPLIRVTSGGAVARGKVTELNLDSIVYDLEGNSISVMIGQTLEGELGLLPLSEGSFVSSSETVSTADDAPASEDANTPATETAKTPASSGDEADILKRLMERRKQELGE